MEGDKLTILSNIHKGCKTIPVTFIILLFINGFDKLHKINHKYTLSIRKTTHELKNAIHKTHEEHTWYMTYNKAQKLLCKIKYNKSLYNKI